MEKEDKKQGKTVCFEISPRNFKRLKPIARKNRCPSADHGKARFSILADPGPPQKSLGRRSGSLFLLIYLSSFYVWDISLMEIIVLRMRCAAFHGHDSGAVWDEKKERFPVGIWKTDPERVPGDRLVSAELTGTRLTVHVRENDGILKAETGSDAPCELTAGSDGTVTKIIVRNGIVRVKAGDEVKTGDVLVSGKPPIYDDSETLVKTNLVHADAEVYAETTRTVTWKIPVVEENPRGNRKETHGRVL